jgi:hypothetical protein
MSKVFGSSTTAGLKLGLEFELVAAAATGTEGPGAGDNTSGGDPPAVADDPPTGGTLDTAADGGLERLPDCDAIPVGALGSPTGGVLQVPAATKVSEGVRESPVTDLPGDGGRP